MRRLVFAYLIRTAIIHVRGKIRDVMHLSMSSTKGVWGGGGGGLGRVTHGNLTVTCIPRVGILII